MGPRDIPLDAGQILLVHYPFTDATAAKVRPALVVSHADFNRGEDFVAVPISSRVWENDPFGFPIRNTDPFFPQTKLKFASTVKWSKPMTLSRVVIQSLLGTLPPGQLGAVLRKIQSLFSVGSDPQTKL
ncbi:MAG: type II toxin-antitoxin system PemK/MazF family toxin [Phycisphaerae bacterium]|nr:type II toxin-antitoxin system PemK/MazF family toxin [Phycisphaerae bacterium]